MKKLLVIAFALFCAATSQAAYLYWQVSSDAAAQFSDANYAKLMYSNKPGQASDVMVGVAEISSSMMQIESSLVTDTNAGSFYIELFNYDAGANQWNSLAVSEFKTYTQLADLGALTTTLVSVPVAWTGGSYAAPEPTSGLLMLLGVAALGLKRRKA